jgi:hypothetical protein
MVDASVPASPAKLKKTSTSGEKASGKNSGKRKRV